MANTAQAKKRVRQAETRRQHNVSLRSTARTMIKKTVRAIQSKDQALAQISYDRMVPVLDRIATTGLMSGNKTARHKSRLIQKLRQLSQN